MLTSDPSCAFCAIVEGVDTSVREIYRDAHVVAFFPTEPATLGHTLLIPLVHVTHLWDVDTALAMRLGRSVVSLSKAVQRAVSPEGINLVQSNGVAASQTVPHLHFHVVPRWTGDRIGKIWPPESHYSEDAKDTAWDAIRLECEELTRDND